MSGFGGYRRILLNCAGVIILVALWHIVSLHVNSVVLASPSSTFAALIGLMGTGRFWMQLAVSFQRVVAGMLLGGFAGFVLGLAAGLNSTVRWLLEPLRWTLMSVPAVVVVVMAMLWFGLGSTMVISITALLVSPIVYIGILGGLDMVDDRIVEMARVYHISRVLALRYIYIPAVAGPLASSLAVATGMGVRIVILAEVMGTATGIGSALAITRSTLEVPELYAWVLVSIGIVAVIEYAVLKPIESRALRWKS
jgi:NitT/TauT family transport system permease protein